VVDTVDPENKVIVLFVEFSRMLVVEVHCVEPVQMGLLIAQSGITLYKNKSAVIAA